MICHNSELIDLAMYKPSNLDESQQIKGFGKQKSERFGDDILAILNAV
jgi:ribonuclease D